MFKRKMRWFALLAVVLLASGTFAPALATAPIVLEETSSYDYVWFSCGDFLVGNTGVHHMKAKVKFDDEFNLLSINSQTQFHGDIINLSTGKYLVEDALWTWNAQFEDDFSTHTVLAGVTWMIKDPHGAVIWLDNGVDLFVGIYVNPITMEIIFTDPYHVAGQTPDYADLAPTICAALR